MPLHLNSQLCVLCGRCCYLTQLLAKFCLMYYLRKVHWHDYRTKTRARRKRRSRMSWGSWESTSSVSTSVSASLETDWQEPPRCWNNWLANNLSSLKVTHLVILTWKMPLTINSALKSGAQAYWIWNFTRPIIITSPELKAIWTKCWNLLLKHHLVNFQPNLAQSILGWRGFKCFQMKGNILFQGEIITKSWK